jgi:integrase
VCRGNVRFVLRSGVPLICARCDREYENARDFWVDVLELAPAALRAVVPAGDLINMYATYLAGRQLSPGTIALRRRHLGWLADTHPDMLGISAADVEAFTHRYATLAPETLKSVMASLRGFYTWAQKRGHVDTDLSFLLEPPRVPKRKARIADERAVLAAASIADPSTRAMLLLGLLAGLRLSEIAQVRIEDRERGWLTVIGKGNKQRRIKETEQLARALDEAQGPRRSGFLFPGRTRGGRRNVVEDRHVNISTVHKRIWNAAGVNPHALRHAAGTAVYDETKDLRLTQEFLGHGSPVTTQIYAHIDEDRMAAAAAALDRRNDHREEADAR